MLNIQLSPEVLEQCHAEGLEAVREGRRMRVLRQKAYRYDRICFWRLVILTILGSLFFMGFVGYIGSI